MKAIRQFLFEVSHPDYGTIQVKVAGNDSINATVAAAKAWGISWTAEARHIQAKGLGPVIEKVCRCGRMFQGAGESCPACTERDRRRKENFFKRYPINKNRREEARR